MRYWKNFAWFYISPARLIKTRKYAPLKIIIDQIKGTVGNAEEKEAWTEIKEHFSENLSKVIQEVKEKCNRNAKVELKSPEEIEFNKRLGLLKKQQEHEKSSKDMWED